jgi:molybdopterin molybdotransferase
MQELSVSNLISVQQSIDILDAVPLQPRRMLMPLLDAMGLRLAEDLFSDRDYPPFDKAVMDGYAVRAADTTAAAATTATTATGARLTVIETIAAGQLASRALQPGQAAKIMTGAPLPPGADAVVPIEQTTRALDTVTLASPIKPGNAIARRGSDAPANQLLLKSGTLLGPAQIAVAASIGRSTVSVFAAPSVALLTTGDELVAVDQQPSGAQIRNSNGPMMLALLRQLGCTVADLGVVRDDPERIRAAIESGLSADALFITGGMSMGEHDYVPRLLAELGLDLKISKLRIKPGKPFVFATGQRATNSPGVTINPQLVFGLPGNPVSAFVCTIRLAGRVLNRLAGGPAAQPIHQLQLASEVPELPPNGPREFYLPAIVTGNQVRPLNPNGSADLFTLARANALIVRSENADRAKSADFVQIITIK